MRRCKILTERITTMPWVFGTNAAETIDGWDGVTHYHDDIWGYDGNDIIYGYDGDDDIDGGRGADTLYGGNGADTAMYADSWEGVFVSLISGQGFLGEAQGDRLYSIENLWGSAHGDTLIGNDGDNVLMGAGGNDMLKGGGGADLLDGQTGIDTVSYSDSDAGVLVLMEIDHASGGHAEGDVLYNVENLTGSAYDDHLWGTEADANVLRGGKGNDSLKGFGGADTLFGGIGADTLYGGTGQDIINGEAGNDTFKFSSAAECGLSRAVADQLSDFSEAQGDKIDLSDIDANTSLAGNQSFLFIGVNNDFHADADPRGQLRFMSDGYVEGDVNGDRVADFYIAVNATTMHDYGFVL
jgi:Ca2+-binding RTX toxin-like protein